VNGKSLMTCLGDLYSVNWMEDADLGNSGETLQAQFNTVKTETNKSHVLQFGDLSIAQEAIADYEGSKDEAVAAPRARASSSTSIVSENAALSSAFHRFAAHGDDASAEELIKMVQDRQAATKRFDSISRHVAGVNAAALPSHDGHILMDCHHAAHEAYKVHCPEWAEGTFTHSRTLAQLCKHTGGKSAPIAAAIAATC